MLILTIIWLPQIWPVRNRCFMVALCHLVREENWKWQPKGLAINRWKYWGSWSAMSRLAIPLLWIFMSSLSVIWCNRWVLSEDHKNHFKGWCFMDSESSVSEFYPGVDKSTSQYSHFTMFGTKYSRMVQVKIVEDSL